MIRHSLCIEAALWAWSTIGRSKTLANVLPFYLQGLLRACKQTRSEAHDLVWDALQFTITLNRFGFQCVKPTGKGKTGTIGGCTFLQKAKAIRVVVPPSRCQPSQRDDESTTERLEALFGALVKSTELNVVEVQCEKEGVHKYLGSNEVSRACWIFVRELQEGGVQARTL